MLLQELRRISYLFQDCEESLKKKTMKHVQGYVASNKPPDATSIYPRMHRKCALSARHSKTRKLLIFIAFAPLATLA